MYWYNYLLLFVMVASGIYSFRCRKEHNFNDFAWSGAVCILFVGFSIGSIAINAILNSEKSKNNKAYFQSKQ